MVEDLEAGVRFDVDQAIEDLESQLEDADLSTSVSAEGQTQRDGDGGGGIGDTILGAEAGSDIATGAGGGGLLGGLGAGGISGSTAILGAISGFLALLEPIQETLSLILRQFERFIVPFVAGLIPVIELVQEVIVQLIKIFRNPNQFLSGLVSQIKNALAPFLNTLIAGFNSIPFVPNINRVSTGGGTPRTIESFRDTGTPEEVKGTDFTGILTHSAISAAATTFGGVGLAYYLLSDDGEVEKRKSQADQQVKEKQ